MTQREPLIGVALSVLTHFVFRSSPARTFPIARREGSDNCPTWYVQSSPFPPSSNLAISFFLSGLEGVMFRASRSLTPNLLGTDGNHDKFQHRADTTPQRNTMKTRVPRWTSCQVRPASVPACFHHTRFKYSFTTGSNPRLRRGGGLVRDETAFHFFVYRLRHRFCRFVASVATPFYISVCSKPHSPPQLASRFNSKGPQAWYPLRVSSGPRG